MEENIISSQTGRTILVSEEEYQTSRNVHQAKLGQKVDGTMISEIIVVPSWIVEAIRFNKIKV